MTKEGKTRESVIVPQLRACDVIPEATARQVEDALEEHNIAGRGICGHVSVEELQTLIGFIPSSDRTADLDQAISLI